VEEYKTMRSHINQAIAMRERVDKHDPDGSRINFEGGDPDTNSRDTPSPKPKEGNGKGKGASDKPGWKIPPEANLSNFVGKKGKKQP
jgi:hypothetical protein